MCQYNSIMKLLLDGLEEKGQLYSWKSLVSINFAGDNSSVYNYGSCTIILMPEFKCRGCWHLHGRTLLVAHVATGPTLQLHVRIQNIATTILSNLEYNQVMKWSIGQSAKTIINSTDFSCCCGTSLHSVFKTHSYSVHRWLTREVNYILSMFSHTALSMGGNWT